ncbi:MAG: hypothetical protein QG579_449 [Patescibacteria group bacterium]|nr:hypothetical protein [Patescibacteria group bacterium]MDQ5969292.1 hypothetical protein [Patescibacteria group bacterium]
MYGMYDILWAVHFMYYPEIKQKAIDLRKEGYSYNYIIKHVPVTKSTLSEWLHNIPYTANKYTIETIGNARIASGRYRHQIRVDSLEKAKQQAKKDIGSLSERDVMMLGLGIYIGEGAKTAGITRIINSDPKIIRLAIKWLQISFGVKKKQIKIRLFLYPDSEEIKSIKYWSKSLNIPTSQFFKPTIDRRMNKKISNHNKLPYGTAHVTVNSLGDKEFGVYLSRRITAWINLVL